MYIILIQIVNHQMIVITFNEFTYLESFEEKLKLSWIIIAHSSGGFYVQTIAKLYPKNVKGLILIDSSYKSNLYFNKIKNKTKDLYFESCIKNWDQIPNPNELKSLDKIY